MSKQQRGQMRSRPSKVMVLSCILGLVAAMVIGVVINNVTAESRFEKEIVAVNKVFSGRDSKKISEVLERTVSSGDYAKVERSLKSYVGDLTNNLGEIEDIMESETIYNSLEGKYLEEHRDNLGATIAELDEAAEKIKALTAEYKKLYNEEKVKEYIKDQGLGENYTALFIENAKLFYEDSDVHQSYDSMLDVLADTIRVEAKALDFLNKNKSAWTVKSGSISFTNSGAASTYNEILQSVANK